MQELKNCGHEYKSEGPQTPDEETLRSEDIMENCPNVIKFQAIAVQIIIGNNIV